MKAPARITTAYRCNQYMLQKFVVECCRTSCIQYFIAIAYLPGGMYSNCVLSHLNELYFFVERLCL